MNIIGRKIFGFRSSRGLTLIECIVALTIFPLAVTAIAYAVVAGQSQAVEALRQARAAMLAEALMEEIVSLSYDPDTDNKLGAEETDRWLYDSPTDFDGFSEIEDGIKWVDRINKKEVPYPSELQRFSRDVSITYCQCGGVGGDKCSADICNMFDPSEPLEVGLLTVTVTVKDHDNEIVTLTRQIVGSLPAKKKLIAKKTIYDIKE